MVVYDEYHNNQELHSQHIKRLFGCRRGRLCSLEKGHLRVVYGLPVSIIDSCSHVYICRHFTFVYTRICIQFPAHDTHTFHRHANLQRRNIAKLKAIKTVRMELRRKAKEEIAFRGRI